MNRLLTLIELLLIGTVISGPVLSEDAMPKQIRSIEGITEYELDNGLQVLLLPDPSRPTVTVNLCSNSSTACPGRRRRFCLTVSWCFVLKKVDRG